MAGFAEGTPTVSVTLDKPRELAFTLGALRRVREKLGSLDIPTDDSPESLAALPHIVWACLDASGRKEVTVEQIEDLIHPGNMAAVSEAITKLFRASTPDVTANPTAAVPASEPATAS